MKRILTCLAGATLALSLFAAEDPSPQHVQWMKDLGGQMDGIRKGQDVQKNAEAAQATMKAVNTFWKARNSEAATKAGDEATKGLETLLAAVKAGDQQQTMAGGKMFGGSCRTCHMAHREKISDTEYKIK